MKKVFLHTNAEITNITAISYDPYRLPPDPKPRRQEAPQRQQQDAQILLSDASKNKPKLEVLEREDELRAQEEEAQRQIRKAEAEKVI